MIQPATERRIINLGKIYGSLEYGTEAISVLEIGRQEKKNLRHSSKPIQRQWISVYGPHCLFRLVWCSSPRHQSQWGVIVTAQ